MKNKNEDIYELSRYITTVKEIMMVSQIKQLNIW